MKKIIKFLKTDVKIINSYLLVAIIIVILISVGLFSYALFFYEKVGDNTISLSVGSAGRVCYPSFTVSSPGAGYIKNEDTAITSDTLYSTSLPTGTGVQVLESNIYLYRTRTRMVSDWGEWTITPCDTSNSELCETAEVKRSRGYAGIGKYTGDYCPSQTYSFFKDKTNIGSVCYWHRWQKTCQLTKAGYDEGCAGSEITYHTTQNTACVGSRSTVCYKTAAGGGIVGYPGIVANYTYDSANSDWVDRIPKYTSKSTANSCGTVGTTTLTESGNTYVLKSKDNTYQCYKYTGNYGAYSEGTCTNTYCLLDADGKGIGECCDDDDPGYRTKTVTYGDWGEWTTTPCDTSNSETCERVIGHSYTETQWKWCKWEKNIDYSGSPIEYIVPKDGYYEIELLGAQGGGISEESSGGSTRGIISLNRGEVLYVYTGEAGLYSNTTCTTGSNTFNGGGGRIAVSSYCGNQGGGATDLRCFYDAATEKCISNTNNLAWDDALGLNSRIMVAGGGGGEASARSIYGNSYGGSLFGGSPKNSTYQQYLGIGGTQVSGGAAPTKFSSATANGTAGSFGIGGNGGANASNTTSGGGSGGGGGYYGGSGSSGLKGGIWPGGGGSSFISGFAGVNAIVESSTPAIRTHTNNTLHYSGKYFINGSMDTGSNTGNGSASIVYIGTTIPRVNTSLNNVRYIKDCIGARDGDNCVDCRNWSSIQAIVNGENIALSPNTSISSTIPTGGWYQSGNVISVIDGDLTGVVSTSYSGIQCVTVDLGVNPDSDDGLWDLDEVFVLHLLNQAITFNNHTLSVGSTLNSGTTSLSTVLIDNESGVAEHIAGKRVNAYE